MIAAPKRDGIPELKFTTGKSPSICFYKSLENQRLRRSADWATACKRTGVGRVPTRSAPSAEWGGRGPFRWNGSFPPASEREARMDDPMVRSRLGRIRNATFGAPDPSGSPLLFPHAADQQTKNLPNNPCMVPPPLVVRSMVSGHMRQIPWRPEFNRDVLLGLDRSSVQESGLVTPLANGAHWRMV